MAKGITRVELQRWAQMGAKARLAEIEQERASLLRAFPGLRQTRATDDGERKAEPKRRRRRRRMSAAARKRISEMMKKRWAERRRAKKGAAGK